MNDVMMCSPMETYNIFKYAASRYRVDILFQPLILQQH